MGYSANILKTDAIYYDLVNATIISNTLTIQSGGRATQHIDNTMLPALTPTMKFTYVASDYSDRYEPDIFATIHVRHSDTREYSNVALYPVLVDASMYECIFTIDDGEYDDMYFTITAINDVTITVWELCPEASDASIETVIDGVKQSLPRLLYDYNTFPLDVSQAETTIAVITCRLIQNTDLQGHFLFTFTASNNATIAIRFYDNEAEELFAPLYYDAHIGNNTIGIPHAYMNRLAGIHSFVVTAQVTYGYLHIDTRRILFTIDGGYLAIRELDIAMDVTDIAIRQLASSNGPDELWLIGIDAGEALVRKRAYTEKNAAVKFDVVGSIGRASAAAIEFDGNWVLHSNAEQYTLETEEVPWYFWVNEYYELCACHGLPSESNMPTVLATAVDNCVKACRGFSSETYGEQDQGLIVAYIKYDGYAYYRQYLRNASTGTASWYPEQKLPFDDEQFNTVNVHRLNDYRVCFELSGDRNVWVISDRTFVGQSVYPERISIGGLHYEPDMYEPLIGYYDTTSIPVVAIDSVYASTETEETVWVDEHKEVHRETRTIYVWTMVLDHAIFGSQVVKSNESRISCTNIREPISKTLEANLLSNKTYVVIKSQYPAQGLIVTITFTPDAYTRVQEDGVVYAYTTGTITGTIDNTIYSTLSTDDSIALALSDNISFTQYEVNYIRESVSEHISIAQDTINVAYYSTVFINTSVEETFSITGVTQFTIFYADSRFDPI